MAVDHVSENQQLLLSGAGLAQHHVWVEFVGSLLCSELHIVPFLSFFQCFWQLVPGCEAAYSTSHGQDHEGQPCSVRLEGTNQERSSAILQ